MLERGRHSTKSTVEHRTCKRLEKARLERKIHREVEIRLAVGKRLEGPFIVKIFQGSLDIVDANPFRPMLTTRLVNRSLKALKPTTRSATVSCSLDDRTRTATTQGKNSS